MKRKIFLVTIILLISITTLYVNIGKQLLHSKTAMHLSSIGITDDQIKSINVYHSFFSVILSYDEWVIRVVYKDEPKATYFYSYKNSKVIPRGVSGLGAPDTKLYKYFENSN